MKLLRRLLIQSHRYLGIALCLLAIMWFASGFVMMYAGGLPRLSPELRLERMPDVDLSKVRLRPAEAVERLGDDPAARVVLLTVLDRPAYRVGGATIFADLDEQKVRLSDGSIHGFEVDPFAKSCLTKGVDELGYTLERLAHIDAFERRHAGHAA